MIDRFLNSYRYLLLIIGVITIPLFFFPGVQNDPFLIPKQALLAIIACFALIVLTYPIENIFKDVSKPLTSALVLLIVCFSISILDSRHIISSLNELKRWLYLLVIFLTTARIQWDFHRLKRLLRISLIVGSIISISVILEYFGYLPFYMFPLSNERLYAFFGYQNIIGQYLIFPVLWGIGVYSVSNNYKGKIVAATCLTLSIIALLVSFCRGAIIATAISAIIFFYLYAKIKGMNFNIRKITSVSVILIAIAIAVIYYSNTITDGKTFYKISILFSKGLNARLPLWTGAINTIFNNPINGVGLGNYVLPDKINAHNEILQIGAETGLTGIFGLSVFSIFVFKQIRYNFSLINIPEVKLLHAAIIAGCIATLIHSIVSYNLHSSASSFLFFAGLGILCANNKAETEHQSHLRKTVTNAVIIFLVASFSLWSIWFEYNMIAGHYTYNRAQLLFLRNNISESLRYSLKAIHYQPRDPRYHLLVSRSYLKKKNLELAEKHYQIAETLSIISPDKDSNIKSIN